MISTRLQHALSGRMALCAVVIFCLTLWIVVRASLPVSDDSMPGLESEKAAAYLKDSGLYNSLQDAVHSVRYRNEAPPRFKRLPERTAARSTTATSATIS